MDDNKPKFKTDMNDRERAKFAGTAREVAKQASALAEALESGDDLKLMIEFMIFSMMISSLSELQKIIVAAAESEKRKIRTEGFLTPEESAARL